MTKEEANTAMLQGKKITHIYFSDNEFIYLKNGQIHDENDYNIDIEFWIWRADIAWDNDWYLYPYSQK